MVRVLGRPSNKTFSLIETKKTLAPAPSVATTLPRGRPRRESSLTTGRSLSTKRILSVYFCMNLGRTLRTNGRQPGTAMANQFDLGQVQAGVADTQFRHVPPGIRHLEAHTPATEMVPLEQRCLRVSAIRNAAFRSAIRKTRRFGPMQFPVGGEAGRRVSGDRVDRTALRFAVCGQKGLAVCEMFL